MSDGELLSLSGKQAADMSLRLTEKWDPKIRSLLKLQTANQASSLWLTSTLPHMAPWTSSNLVTLPGGAIHAMSPTAGAGANTALRERDAAALCQMFVHAGEGGVTVEDVRAYEAKMRE
jgi:2-polyprenyl-6-methoxyphenol hydroxylase-like FAD-dependent oxidoreductase